MILEILTSFDNNIMQKEVFVDKTKIVVTHGGAPKYLEAGKVLQTRLLFQPDLCILLSAKGGEKQSGVASLVFYIIGSLVKTQSEWMN